ncbi:hypothetical protein [Streptomyces yangpuensis]
MSSGQCVREGAVGCSLEINCELVKMARAPRHSSQLALVAA